MTYRKTLFITAAVLVLGGTACRHKVELPEKEPLKVSVAVIDSVAGGMTRTYVGEVQEDMSIALSFPTGGKITSVHVKDGDHVTAGQLLATIDNSNAQNAYKSAAATLKQAEDGYRRLKKVYEQGSLPEVKWVEMLTNLEKARSMEQLAKKQVEECSMYAPVSGIVNKCNINAGARLLPGEPAMTILDMNSVSVVFSVPESDIAAIAIGSPAMLAVPALQDKTIACTVTDKGVESNRISHSYQVKIKLANADGSLMPGMVCKVSLAGRSSEGIVVPARAVQTRPDGLSVWVVHNGQAQIRYIQSAGFTAGGVAVASGLTYGDTVITAGYQKLYSNAPVSVSSSR
jgi:membrane fusion protein, multidrug efflux system